MKFTTAFVFLAAAIGSVFAAPAAGNVQVARAEANFPHQRDVDAFEKRAVPFGLSGANAPVLAARSEAAQNEARAIEARGVIDDVVASLNNLITTLQTALNNGTTLTTAVITNLVTQISALVTSLLGAVLSGVSVNPTVINSLVTAVLALVAGNINNALNALKAALIALS